MGYQVWYEVKNTGFKTKVYWTLSKSDAENYAMIIKKIHHGGYDAYIIPDSK